MEINTIQSKWQFFMINGYVLTASCGSLMCYNGATCLYGINGYYCSCPNGYTGSECQTCEYNRFTVLFARVSELFEHDNNIGETCLFESFTQFVCTVNLYCFSFEARLPFRPTVIYCKYRSYCLNEKTLLYCEL